MLKRNTLQYALITSFCLLTFVQSLSAQTIPKEELIFYTQKWKGERFSNGRPKVPQQILQQIKYISIEQAWGFLRSRGYYNQYEGDWTILHPDQPIVGRALTAEYMPSRPDMKQPMLKRGHKNGRSKSMNSWPIDALQKGDVYVADGFGKIKDGTLIGDRLGTTIYDNSGNGVIFNGSARDLEGLQKIKGFNAFVKGWHPSYIMNMMLTGLNTPIRIGHATVLPGDVVLAKKEGTVFIPAYLAEPLVKHAEVVRLTDAFAHERVGDGTYTAGQVDSKWSQGMKNDFLNWINKKRHTLQDSLHVLPKVINRMIKTEKIHDELKPTDN